MVQTVTSPAADATAANALRTRALGSLGKLPPFSPILSKLMATLAGQDVAFSVLGDLIEKDTVVAGNLLRVVNSALYARRNTVNSVRHALSVLGLGKVRNTVLAMSVSRMLNQVKTPKGFSMERFNKHSAAVAVLSDHLAQHVTVAYPEGAFVAGLLHDVGRLLIAMALPEEFDPMLRAYQHTELPWIECEMERLGFTHPELSADVLAAWKLPPPIQDAARQHHDPPPATPAGALSLGRVVQAADQYVNSIGESIVPHRKTDVVEVSALASLDLAPEELERILAAFETEHSTLGQFYL